MTDRSGTDVRGERELKLAARAHLDEAIADGNPDEAYHWAAVMDAFRWADEDEPSIPIKDLPRPTEMRRLAEAIDSMRRMLRDGWVLAKPHAKQDSTTPTTYERVRTPDLPLIDLSRIADRVEIRLMRPLDSAQRRALHHWVDLAVADTRSEDDALHLEERLRHLIDET